MGKIKIDDGYAGYMLWFNSNNTIDFYFAGGVRVDSATFINANTWYNVVGTYNGTTSSIYINGVLDLSTNNTVSANASGSNFIVGSYGAARNFTGKISNILAYNRALSAAEIQQNYNALKSRYI